MSVSYRDDAPLGADDPTPAPDRPAASAARVPLRVIEPDGSARGGIIVLHESREFADELLRLMASLSSEGWIVVAPNLFHRGDVAEGEGVFGPDLFDDFDASFDWLVERGVFPDCTGVLGFDSAGTAAFQVATDRPIGAAVSVAAPGIIEPITVRAVALIEAAPRLRAPWLGLYSTDDPATPADQVEQLRDAAAAAAVATLVVSYPGLRHRPDRPGFDDDDDADVDTLIDAQTRIFDWFDAHLR
ncbi:dienelactone hydrolase family protein [Nocardia sp. NEAU-G5]|uniref:Dienelactone hydrolase family protein n=1 Tax=Nocardia albiluteola TaxID=2842303 RepID=A0ABS6ASP9_9NOCA|nr:dienelactone hydrolase family protein [Nocardia albiluteola]MBU3060266.1 dienelactone hydrolase family protein [Nocardia albiluteola]